MKRIEAGAATYVGEAAAAAAGMAVAAAKAPAACDKRMHEESGRERV